MSRVLNFDVENKGKKYRYKLEIVRDMLLAASEEIKKTRIMYRANLSRQLLEKYLKNLLEGDLIKYNDGSGYLITDKGKDFLQRYNDYLERCRRICEDIEGADKNRLLLEDMCFTNLKCIAEGRRVNE